VILIAFTREQLLSERSSVLRYRYIAFFSFVIDIVTSVSSHYISLLLFPLLPEGTFMLLTGCISFVLSPGTAVEKGSSTQ